MPARGLGGVLFVRRPSLATYLWAGGGLAAPFRRATKFGGAVLAGEGAWRHTFRVAAELGGTVLEAGPWQRTFRSAAAGIGGAVLGGGGEAWRRCFGRRRSLAAHFSCGGRAWRRSFGAAAGLGGRRSFWQLSLLILNTRARSFSRVLVLSYVLKLVF